MRTSKYNAHIETFGIIAHQLCYRVVPTESYLQFSRAPTMANFGDLPRGEIPEPLKYNRPMCKARFSLSSPSPTILLFIIIVSAYRVHYPR